MKTTFSQDHIDSHGSCANTAVCKWIASTYQPIHVCSSVWKLTVRLFFHTSYSLLISMKDTVFVFFSSPLLFKLWFLFSKALQQARLSYIYLSSPRNSTLTEPFHTLHVTTNWFVWVACLDRFAASKQIAARTQRMDKKWLFILCNLKK